MTDLLNEIKRISAEQNQDQWVPFSEIRDLYPGEYHVEGLVIETTLLLKREVIDVLIEGENLFFRPL